MALIDRLAHESREDSIANHAFSAAVWFWAKGDITRPQVVDGFALSTDDEVQLDQLQAHYVSLSAGEKRSFHSDLEAAGMLLEVGLIGKVKYKSLLGLT